jgi:hypothetical protein
LKVLEGQNMVIRVVICMVIGMVIRMVILYGYGVLEGPHYCRTYYKAVRGGRRRVDFIIRKKNLSTFPK